MAKLEKADQALEVAAELLKASADSQGAQQEVQAVVMANLRLRQGNVEMAFDLAERDLLALQKYAGSSSASSNPKVRVGCHRRLVRQCRS